MAHRIDTAALLRENPILSTLEGKYSMVFEKQGAEYYAPCPFHQDGGRPNFRVNAEKGLWTCPVCGPDANGKTGGNIITFVMKKDSLGFVDACKALGAKVDDSDGHDSQRNGSKGVWNPVSTAPAAVYDYYDLSDVLRYQVCRFERPSSEKECGYEKTFRQRQPNQSGGWIWNLDGVERIPYKVREFTNTCGLVNIVEGEKDAETLISLGFLATTNAQGAGHWLYAFAPFLNGREIAIWPDNDAPGLDHAKDVLKKITQAIRNARMMRVPDPHKDITEWVNSFGDDSAATAAINALIEKTMPMYGGIEIPIYSLPELELKYIHQVQHTETTTLNLSRWLPSLQGHVRGMIPGEVGVFLAGTGVGKTALLQNLAMAAEPLCTVLFEYELPGELTFERFAAASTGITCAEVESFYRAGMNVEWAESRPMGHIFVCPKTDIKISRLEELIEKAELKIGARPVLVCVDYVQLVPFESKSRYEKVSYVSEMLKAVAKNTNTIIFVASQIARPLDEEKPEVGLYDGKESGSIENSAGLVLGVWRAPEHPLTQMEIKVLKNTKGTAGKLVHCNFNGETMQITEMASVDERDIPRQRRNGESEDWETARRASQSSLPMSDR